MKTPRVRSGALWAAIAGLLLCALGIAALWSLGAPFPVALPPGAANTGSSSRSEILFLLVGAVFATVARWRWAPAVAAVLGAVFTVGFLADPDGIANLAGERGAVAAVAQALHLAGGATAAIAGAVATLARYRAPRIAQPSRR